MRLLKYFWFNENSYVFSDLSVLNITQVYIFLLCVYVFPKLIQVTDQIS